MRSLYIEGDARPQIRDVEDFAWVTKTELQGFIGAEQFKSLESSLL